MVRSELVKHFGEQAIDSGYKVYTTINANAKLLQKKLYKMVLKLMTVVMAGVVQKHMTNP
jgi:membrane carboxypeptidase/penicillin-binding protein